MKANQQTQTSNQSNNDTNAKKPRKAIKHIKKQIKYNHPNKQNIPNPNSQSVAYTQITELTP